MGYERLIGAIAFLHQGEPTEQQEEQLSPIDRFNALGERIVGLDTNRINATYAGVRVPFDHDLDGISVHLRACFEGRIDDSNRRLFYVSAFWSNGSDVVERQHVSINSLNQMPVNPSTVSMIAELEVSVGDAENQLR